MPKLKISQHHWRNAHMWYTLVAKRLPNALQNKLLFWIWVCVCVLCVYVCMYVCMYVRIFLYLSIYSTSAPSYTHTSHTHTHTHTHTYTPHTHITHITHTYHTHIIHITQTHTHHTSARKCWEYPMSSGWHPPSREDHSMAAVDANVYVFGGNHDGKLLNSLCVLEVKSMKGLMCVCDVCVRVCVCAC